MSSTQLSTLRRSSGIPFNDQPTGVPPKSSSLPTKQEKTTQHLHNKPLTDFHLYVHTLPKRVHAPLTMAQVETNENVSMLQQQLPYIRADYEDLWHISEAERDDKRILKEVVMEWEEALTQLSLVVLSLVGVTHAIDEIREPMIAENEGVSVSTKLASNSEADLEARIAKAVEASVGAAKEDWNTEQKASMDAMRKDFASARESTVTEAQKRIEADTRMARKDFFGASNGDLQRMIEEAVTDAMSQKTLQEKLEVPLAIESAKQEVLEVVSAVSAMVGEIQAGFEKAVQSSDNRLPITLDAFKGEIKFDLEEIRGKIRAIQTQDDPTERLVNLQDRLKVVEEICNGDADEVTADLKRMVDPILQKLDDTVGSAEAEVEKFVEIAKTEATTQREDVESLIRTIAQRSTDCQEKIEEVGRKAHAAILESTVAAMDGIALQATNANQLVTSASIAAYTMLDRLGTTNEVVKPEQPFQQDDTLHEQVNELQYQFGLLRSEIRPFALVKKRVNKGTRELGRMELASRS